MGEDEAGREKNEEGEERGRGRGEGGGMKGVHGARCSDVVMMKRHMWSYDVSLIHNI